MPSPTAGAIVTIVSLLAFAALGIRAAARFGVADRDRYLTARGTQGSGALALSFFASALGAWILFAPPEVGTFGGLLGVLGYALGQALAIWIFAALGPSMRRRLPAGTTILEFARMRFGRPLQLHVGAISVLYMFLFLTAELTAIGGVAALLTGADPLVPVLAVAGITVAYTAYGGLPASLETDRWQGWLVIALIVTTAVAVSGEAERPLALASAGGLGEISRLGAETMVVLAIAIVAANLFHQGFWQRAWAARDDRALRRGATLGSLLILPVVFLTGAFGAIAAGAGRAEPASVAFFGLLQGLPWGLLLVVLALAVALVASSVDTLENALTSVAAVHLGPRGLGLGGARLLTVALTIPAALLAVQGHSVLRLFLIADLLAATAVLPVFLGLWRRVTPAAALLGALAGILGVIVLGWVRGGALTDGLLLWTLPNGPTLGPFVVAPLASGLVTLLVSVATRSGEPAR